MLQCYDVVEVVEVIEGLTLRPLGRSSAMNRWRARCLLACTSALVCVRICWCTLMWQGMHSSWQLAGSKARRAISCSVRACSTGRMWCTSTPGVMYPSALHSSHRPLARWNTEALSCFHARLFSSRWYRLSLLMCSPFRAERREVHIGFEVVGVVVVVVAVALLCLHV